jgi:hypothetical protein
MAENDMTDEFNSGLPTVTGPARLPSPLEQLVAATDPRLN